MVQSLVFECLGFGVQGMVQSAKYSSSKASTLQARQSSKTLVGPAFNLCRDAVDAIARKPWTSKHQRQATSIVRTLTPKLDSTAYEGWLWLCLLLLCYGLGLRTVLAQPARAQHDKAHMRKHLI